MIKQDQVHFLYDVIVPAFNAEKTIEATLKSVQQQSILPQQILVIDDGSTDNTATVAASLSARVLGQSHQGVAAARSFGLSLVTAPYFAIADADDQWLPLLSELQAAWWFDASPRTAAIAAAPLLRSEIVPHESSVGRPVETTAEPALLIPPSSLWRRNALTSSATFYSTPAVKAVGGFRSFEVGEDYDLHLRLVAAGYELRASPTPGIIYFERRGSITGRVEAGLMCTGTMLRDFYESPFRQQAIPDASLPVRRLFLYVDTLKLALRRGSNLAPLRGPQALKFVPRLLRPPAMLITYAGPLASIAFRCYLYVRSVFRSRKPRSAPRTPKR